MIDPGSPRPVLPAKIREANAEIMRNYAVTVVASGTSVVLRATGDLNSKAASHLLELARSALAVHCSKVVIDLGGVSSSTRTAQRILTAGKAGRLPGAVRVRPEPVG